MSDNKLVKTIVNGAIFGPAFFAVERLLKLARDQNKMTKNMLSQREEKLLQCEEKLSQRKEELLKCEEKLSQCGEH